MNKFIRCFFINTILMALVSAIYAETPGDSRITVPLSDPTRPATVKASLFDGSISIRGYSGREVVVDARSLDGETHRRRALADTSGMKRVLSTSLTVEEEGNVVSISSGSFAQQLDVTIQVPTRTSLKLETMNGDIKVEQVHGEIQASNMNGPVTLIQVSGSVVAHAFNKNVSVTMTSIDPDKPMSFSSFNGDIDVTFPPDFKADVTMKTDNGEIFTGFDIKTDSNASQSRSDARGGKFRVRIDNTIKGTINGGGPKIQFKTFNGNIYLRKSAR